MCDYVAGGGTALVGYFSGIVDENDHIRLGGYPAPFRELLGITVEEFFPLRTGERVHLTTDSGEEWTSGLWTELMTADGCDVVASYSDGPLVGHPAVTRNSSTSLMAAPSRAFTRTPSISTAPVAGTR